jgi:hypothetical protein
MTAFTRHRPATGLRDILVTQSRRYPHWNIEDLYKLIHQAAMGSEHAVSDETRAHEWLLGEIQDLGDGPDEPLIDTISPDGGVVRIHLRPLVRANKDIEQLFHAFLRTARYFHGSETRLEMYGKSAVWIAQDGVFPFSADKLAAYIKHMKESDFPAVHHSAVFESAYRPAYRVVAREFLPEDLIALA